MGRLSNLRVVDPVLTNLSVGYSNADLVGDVLFPFVPVDKEGGKIPKFARKPSRFTTPSGRCGPSPTASIPKTWTASPSPSTSTIWNTRSTTARATRPPSLSKRTPPTS